ncbi:hypothetical protein DPEC_G00324620 [Dallia pectoralis]|uniref:Uncharacterized protein n=1 Tax=Dallia pectoralis TaxID=75939 RepID=A0ACC2FB02_DALPE|nr:hypothetical protein DPEC_G00324620 [Dallia pectoralis]
MSAKNSQLAKAQEEADEVKVIMLDNMQKTEERKFKLQELDERADQLQMKSKAFQKTSVKLKKKKRCDNIKAKWKLIAVVSSMALIIFLVAVFILVPGFFKPLCTVDACPPPDRNQPTRPVPYDGAQTQTPGRGLNSSES